jgi:hypothetical protein
MKGEKEPEKFLAEKRLQKHLKRKQLVEQRIERNRRDGTRLMGRGVVYYGDSLMGWLAAKGMGRSRRLSGNSPFVTIPERFSIITDPDAVIDTLSTLTEVVRLAKHMTGIHFDHGGVREYDLAAEIALGTLASEIQHAFRAAGKQVRIGGKFPTSAAEVRLLKAIGIIWHLRIAHEYVAPKDALELEIFEAHRRQGPAEVVFGARDRKSNEIKKFVDHIDKCLRRNHRTLSDHGVERLAMYSGEVLANAEEHTRRGEWILAGYLDNATDDHMCEIAVISFGDTFAESFRRLPLSNYAWRKIQPYLDAHTEKRFFSTNWDVDDLIALAALQGGVSCKNSGPTDTRGKGTVDLITFFEQMHKECAAGSKTPCEMAIVTGKTYIKFDGTYKLGRDSTDRDVIAFNKSNRLEDAPDPMYVRRLSQGFPGTIISMRFQLQPSFTEPTSETDGV